MGQKLITAVTANMLDGVYSQKEWDPLKPDLYSVLTGWRMEAENARGQREQDNNLRDFFRALYRLNETPSHQGDHQSRDMKADFEKELAAFKQRIQLEENQLKAESK